MRVSIAIPLLSIVDEYSESSGAGYVNILGFSAELTLAAEFALMIAKVLPLEELTGAAGYGTSTELDA